MDAIYLAILIGVAAATAVVGYWLVSLLDRFLAENRKAMATHEEAQEPAVLLLSPALSEEELISEVRRFRKHHEGAFLLLQEQGTQKKKNRRPWQ